MTRRDQRALMRYCRWVANELALRDWTLHFDWDTDPGPSPLDGDENSAASIDCIVGRKHALLRFASGFREYEPDKQRHYVVHELVHCHLSLMSDQVDNDLRQHLGRPAFDIFDRGFERALEFATDGIADAFSHRMPKIDWPE